MTCRSCQASIQGTYCHACGQKVLPRFSFASVARWVAQELVVLDRGFLFTLKELLLRPALVAREYIGGATKRYYNPFKLLLLATTAPFIVLALTPDFQSAAGNVELLRASPPPFTLQFANYLLANFPFFLLINFLWYFLISVPCWALFCRGLFHGSNLNYIEHLIFVSFLAAATVVGMFGLVPLVRLLTVVMPLDSDLTFGLLILALWMLLVVFMVRTCKLFYNESYIAVIWKGALAAYAGLGVSVTLQFLILSAWRAWL